MLPLLEPGVVLAGKYRVERVLGQGGMGVVLAAHHLQLGQRVALKFLLPEVCTSGEAVARFLREARAAVQIESEHVARVVDVGTLETGSPYMVMEYLEGSDLGDVLQKRGPMPLQLAAGYVLEAMEAVAEAHALGMVHRDLKPSNLFLARRRDGSFIVKVLDFGISKAAQDAHGPSASMTSTHAVMGSPLYMSPEQVRSSKDVDARADIWSLGVILHELLCGRTPFHGETMTAVLAMIAADPPPPLRTVRPDLSPAIEALVLRCLNKDRTQRFQNVAELAYALAPFVGPEAHGPVERISKVLGRPAMASSQNLAQSSPAVSGGVQTAGAWGHTQPGEAKSKKPLVYLGVGAVLIAGAAAGALLFRPAADETAASASAASLETAAAAPAVPTTTVPATAAPLPPEPVVTPAAPIVEPSAAPLPEAAPAPVARTQRNTRTSRNTRSSSPATPTAVVVAPTREAPPSSPPPAAPKSNKGLFDDTK
jgi:hypothetical protein